MVKETTAYICDDGTIFENQIDAETHEQKGRIEKSFQKIYGDYEGCRIDYRDFIDWIEENPVYCKELFNFILKTKLRKIK